MFAFLAPKISITLTHLLGHGHVPHKPNKLLYFVASAGVRSYNRLLHLKVCIFKKKLKGFYEKRKNTKQY